MSLCVHVSMCPSLRVSMSPCLRVSMCLMYVSVCPCVHVSMCPCLRFCIHVNVSCFNVSMSTCLHLYVSMILEFRGSKRLIQKKFRLKFLKSLSVDTLRQTENGTNGKHQLLLFCCKGKRKRQTSVSLLQSETENGSLFSLVGKR
jgi:hypothetical protein